MSSTRIHKIAIMFCLWPMSSHAETQRDLDSHEHGASTLNVLIDDSTVLLEFASPWVNLVGFEHAPSTDEQQAAVDEALSQLERADQLFVLDDGGVCRSTLSNLSSSMATPASTGDGAEDVHGEEDHEDEDHEDEDHEEEGHEEEVHSDEEHNEEQHESHSELTANYAFECDNSAPLNTLKINLFDVWPGIEDLDVQLVGPGGQTMYELNAADRVIDLASVN